MVISVSLLVQSITWRESEDLYRSAAPHKYCHLEVSQGSAKGANGKQRRSNAIDERDPNQHQVNQGM